MARWDQYCHDKASIAPNWLDSDPNAVRLPRLMKDRKG